MILSRTHGKIKDTWYCELSTPKFSDTNYLSDYCVAMQEHFHREKSCNGDYSSIEHTRMYLANLDYTSFKEDKNSLLQEIRGNKLIESTAKPNLHLMMLTGTT